MRQLRIGSAAKNQEEKREFSTTLEAGIRRSEYPVFSISQHYPTHLRIRDDLLIKSINLGKLRVIRKGTLGTNKWTLSKQDNSYQDVYTTLLRIYFPFLAYLPDIQFRRLLQDKSNFHSTTLTLLDDVILTKVSMSFNNLQQSDTGLKFEPLTPSVLVHISKLVNRLVLSGNWSSRLNGNWDCYWVALLYQSADYGMELLSYHGMVEFRKGPVTGQGENRKGIITKYFASASIGKYGCYPILTCGLDLSSNLSHHYTVMKIYLFNFLIFHCIPGACRTLANISPIIHGINYLTRIYSLLPPSYTNYLEEIHVLTPQYLFSRIYGQIPINGGTWIRFLNLFQLRKGLGRDILREILEGTADILESVGWMTLESGLRSGDIMKHALLYEEGHEPIWELNFNSVISPISITHIVQGLSRIFDVTIAKGFHPQRIKLTSRDSDAQSVIITSIETPPTTQDFK